MLFLYKNVRNNNPYRYFVGIISIWNIHLKLRNWNRDQYKKPSYVSRTKPKGQSGNKDEETKGRCRKGGGCAAGKILNSFRISYLDCTRDRKLSTTPSIINVYPGGFNWSSSPFDYRDPIFHILSYPLFTPQPPQPPFFSRSYLALIRLADSISMAFNLLWQTIMNLIKPTRKAG